MNTNYTEDEDDDVPEVGSAGHYARWFAQNLANEWEDYWIAECLYENTYATDVNREDVLEDAREDAPEDAPEDTIEDTQ